MRDSIVATSTPAIPPAALPLPVLAALAGVAVLFGPTFAGLAGEWWNNPDAGHGLLLVPLAAWLCWRTGLVSHRQPARVAGLLLITFAVLLRIGGGIAAELFTQRVALLLSLVALTLFFVGWRQLLAWWLPIGLFALAIPLPAVILNQLALPLQLLASKMGAALLEMRNIPVRLAGNVILLPGHQLFVTEACSGLRSLTSLLSIGLLLGGVWLSSPWLRGMVMIAAVLVAVGMNALRVFLTGFLVFFISPAAGDGFLHLSQGWLMFLISLCILAGVTWLLGRVERRHGADRGEAFDA